MQNLFHKESLSVEIQLNQSKDKKQKLDIVMYYLMQINQKNVVLGNIFVKLSKYYE